MNVLIVSEVFFLDDPGGAARVHWEIARGIVRHGHSVYMLARQVNKKSSRQEEYDGVQVLRYPWHPRNPLLSLWLARGMVQDLPVLPDVLHVHEPFSGLIAYWFKISAHIPELYFFYSSWAQEYRIRQQFNRTLNPIHHIGAWVRNSLEGFTIHCSDCVVTLSQFTADQLQFYHPVSQDKIVKINGAVDTERFQPGRAVVEARKTLGWPPDKKILLTVRRLEARMGLGNLLEALAELVRDERDLHLYIVGQGSLRAYLEEKVRDLRLEAAVTFAGLVAEDSLPLCYQAADVFVLPTQELEGFGLVTVEALACGCPVVGTRVGATPEILGPLDPSLLVDGTTPAEIARALENFLRREESWPDLRRQCAAYAREKYAWDRVVGEVEELTARLCQKRI